MKSDFLTKTYLVCNSQVFTHIRKIEGFSLNLGRSLLNLDKKFIPADVVIQKHIMFFDEILQLNGYLGSLHISVNSRYQVGQFSVFNEKNRVDVKMENKDILEALNEGLNKMADICGIKADIVPPSETKKEEIYVRPKKKLEEMNLEERLLFARNRK